MTLYNITKAKILLGSKQSQKNILDKENTDLKKQNEKLLSNSSLLNFKDSENKMFRKEIETLHLQKKQTSEKFHKEYTGAIDENARIKNTLLNNIKHLKLKI